jgi:hypothetical protein
MAGLLCPANEPSLTPILAFPMPPRVFQKEGRQEKEERSAENDAVFTIYGKSYQEKYIHKWNEYTFFMGRFAKAVLTYLIFVGGSGGLLLLGPKSGLLDDGEDLIALS